MFKKISIENNPMPRYYQAKMKIEEAIVKGFYKKGDRLPPERKLSEQLGVSMITVRKALDEIANEGIVEKMWGKGVYVRKMPRPAKAGRKKIALTVLHGEENLGHPALTSFLNGIGEVLENNTDVNLEIIFVTQNMLKNSDYSAILNGNFDGMIVTVLEIPKNELDALKEKLPNIVCINRKDIFPSIVFDYSDATRKIMQYLHGLGHTRIALLAGTKDTIIPETIYETYANYFKTQHIRLDDNMAKFGNYTRKDAYDLAMKILNDTNVTAIIAGDDNMAVGALDAVTESGLHCPRDISICSFNDFPIATIVKPNFTTVKIPFNDIGRQAGNMLIDAINGKPLERLVRVKGDLIIRDSSAACNTGRDDKSADAYIIQENI